MRDTQFQFFRIFQALFELDMRSENHKPGRAIQNCIPFICLNMPFVCSNKSVIHPFIRQNIPLVRNRGLTLVELIVVLTIAGILAALAAPSMQGFVSSNRLTAQVNDLLADISLARSEAIKQNTTTGVCVTASGGTSCVVAGNWANGWMVYANVGGVTTPIRTHEALTGSNTLTFPAGDAVIYDRSGIMTSPTSTSSFTLCDPKMKKTRVVTLATTGRPTLSEGSC